MSTLPLRDQIRLRLQSMRHTTAWMQTVPKYGVPTTIPGGEYRTLLRWWLGMPLFHGDSARPCPLCNDAMDPFGDHLVSCRFNSLAERHHDVRKALADCLQGAGIACIPKDSLPGSMQRPRDNSFPFFRCYGQIDGGSCCVPSSSSAESLPLHSRLLWLGDKEGVS